MQHFSFGGEYTSAFLGTDSSRKRIPQDSRKDSSLRAFRLLKTQACVPKQVSGIRATAINRRREILRVEKICINLRFKAPCPAKGEYSVSLTVNPPRQPLLEELEKTNQLDVPALPGGSLLLLTSPEQGNHTPNSVD